ncbi:penicillin-insensitive murein endopeptidase [Phaeobacter gallaeciensis]|nr:penicillin-insensitive murein endopeptidase [Phaeobacter gallaeciensis]
MQSTPGFWHVLPMTKLVGHGLIVLFLTMVTQIGGLAWLVSRLFRRSLLAFVIVYAAFSFAAQYTAPVFGRTPLSCFGSGNLQVQSWFYCALNRTYVSPALLEVLQDNADAVAREYPGTVTLVLDGNFPFWDGFPLLPHLSHDDGEKADLAFFYSEDGRYVPGAVRSPIGYFAFESGPTECRKSWLSLRWDLGWAQGIWRDLLFEEGRTFFLVKVLAEDARVQKVFIEPHLKDRMGADFRKIRFQGCRAARHDDHIHVQL